MVNFGKSSPLVDAPCGAIQGKYDQLQQVKQFQGIPYAKPPVGELRWQPPQVLEPWSHLREATRYGMPAPQNPSELFQIRGPGGEEPTNEDCLYLNIYAPAKPRHDKLPVMVWIHGGSFYLGSSCQTLYDGKYLASSGRAIVVTLNYRLGALGFLRLCDLSDIPATGNEGLMDQLAALEWVNRNIAAFGGDPENVTLFGESAGAMSISSLFSACPQGDKPLCGRLFHKAIVQSGNPGVFHQTDNANSLAELYLDTLAAGVGKTNLSDLSTEKLLQAQASLISSQAMHARWGHLPFKPVQDGEFLLHSPADALQSPAAAGIPMMVGSNSDEWNLFSAARPETYTLDDQQIRDHLQQQIPDPMISKLLEYYRARAEALQDDPWPLWSRAWNLILTDMVFTVPGLRLLNAHQGKRFHYHFTQPLSAQPLLGACHAAELGYVFGTHGAGDLAHFYGGETKPHRLSESMRNAWLNFAESGNPGDDWPAFDQGHTQQFGEHSKRDLDSAALQTLWQGMDDQQLRGFL
ncbi:carboxylesterase/lipase family protein [Microbulbifer agarilyticus]|uniref:carboxylesterase/lipase family protein n=1 Tax=Microbulbifer agarilyticus TaxID=260552 RepID=UPI001CD6FE1F|nr:carboxylesterase family protein [Microbulbifer agarilyticus]MCA0893957.1 carboxylesterase family protein [Microbulbifer agarilyticus]